MLQQLSPLPREDLQDEAAIAIATDEIARAENAVHALLRADHADPVGLLLAAQLSIQNGSADDARSSLRKIFENNNATEQQQLQAALMELSLASGSAGADEGLTDAWSRIEKIAHGKSASARDALVLLAQRSVAPASDGTRPIAMTTDEIRTALENHPLSKAPQKLLALDLQERLDASRRGELLSKGIAEFKNGDAEELLALATWLNGKKEFEKMLEAIPLEKALTSRELFLQYLDALGALNRWSEVKQLLQSDRFPLDQAVQKMYLARCNAQLGEKTAAENNWQRALEAAGDPGKLITVGEYAERNGVLDVAKSAFANAAQQSPKLRVAQQGRLRMAQRTGDTNKIHEVLAEMLKIWPRDAAIQNDEGYTRLLLIHPEQTRERSKIEDRRSPQTGQSPSSQLPTPADELDQIARAAATLVERNPRSLPHRTFLALARLKQNRAADALAVYEKITVARNALTPSALAIHAVVLAANGRVEEAQAEARQVKIDNLLPEERSLIDRLPYD